MKYFLSLLLLCCSVFSCRQHPGTGHPGTDSIATTAGAPVAAGDTARTDTSTTAKSFFPVPDYIGGQLHMIDSMQYPLTRAVTINHQTSRGTISDAELRKLAAAFRRPDINDSSLRKFYKESSLEDQGLGAVILSYSATNPSLEIQKIDVIVKPGVSGDKVKTLYIEKQRSSGDTTIRQKLFWKADHHFQIVTEKQVGHNVLPAEQVQVVWDPVE